MIKTMVQVMLFPVWLAAAGLGAVWAYRQGGAISMIVSAVGAASFVMATLLERVLPYRRDWGVNREDLPTDLASFGSLAAVVDPLVKLLAASLALGLVAMLGSWGMALFPAEAPLAIQILLVFLIAEFGRYWAHRWHHESALLWRFHAMHHSSTRLYALNNFRLHPLNHLINYGIGLFPLAVLGAPELPLLVYAAVMMAMTFLQHANIDLKFGPLNYLFSTNALHRWHHSTRLSEGNRNYGSVLIVWDLLFGTYHPARAPHAPDRIGVMGGDYPERGYLRQLIWPWRLRCCPA